MGWQDRDYSQSGYEGRGRPMMGGGFVWPRITPMVKKLLIANVAVFVACNIFGVSEFLNWGVLSFDSAIRRGQIWRFVTYQYLHEDGWHIFGNMIGLYFLGTLLEQRWGGRKFFLLYTLFGIVGAMLHSLLSALDVIQGGLLIGASGSVLGLIGACFVAAPQVRLLVFFVFPVSIRTVAIVLGAISLLSILGETKDRIAHACHLGGLAMGFLWAWMEAKGIIRWPSRVQGSVGPTGRKWVQLKIRKGAWERKMKRQQAQQAEIDRILKKVHEKGLNSLSRQEKNVLQQASKEKKGTK